MVRLLIALLLASCCNGAMASSVEGQTADGHVMRQGGDKGMAGKLDDSHAVVLEALLDGHVLSDSLTAYQDGDHFLLPLGELARLLTLAVTVNVQEGSASGFLVKEDQLFGLHLGRALANVDGRNQQFDARMAQMVGDDIYVAQHLLTQWLRIDFELDLSTLQLRIKPRIKLPMQARLQREKQGAPPFGSGSARSQGGDFALQDVPYAVSRAPFVDQTIGSDARFGRNAAQYKTAYAAYITTDFLGMEAAAYVSASKDKPAPDMRLALSRHDPEGQLLGPMQARTLELGHVVLPSVPNVLTSGKAGVGVAIDNHALGQPSQFDRHSIRGDLPPGWDVTLYYNDALVAYQPAGADGRYAFDDLPLSFGPNEFRLVFNGPLGQVKVERQSYLLDQSVVKPGEFFYALASQQGDQGVRHIGQFDLGLTSSLSAHLGLASIPREAAQAPDTFTQLGLRAYGKGMIVNAQASTSPGGGLITDVALKTRLGKFALGMEHQQRNSRFNSEALSAGQEGIRYRDKVGLTGSIPRDEAAAISLAWEAFRDVLKQGPGNMGTAARVSTVVLGSALSNNLRWQRAAGKYSVDGALQVSRRVADLGLNAQVDYAVRPEMAARTYAITADQNLAGGYRVNGGILHSTVAGSTQLSAGVSKSFGGFAVALSGGYSSKRELVLGLQVFMALGREPRSGAWFAEAQPLAGSGAASVQAFVDKNMNGTRDPGEEPVPNAGFLMGSGGRHPGRTNSEGQLFIQRLTPGQYTDIALDASTLEDPQWKPSVKGVRVLPRPGLVQTIEFPVVYTAEVEGTVYLVDQQGRRRGIGDARLELVTEDGELLATTRSSPDGYYLLHQVTPGPAVLRIAPEQAAKLRLKGALSRRLNVPGDGEFLSGQDIELQIAAH